TVVFAYSKRELSRKSPGILIIFVAFILTFSLSAFIGITFSIILFLLIRNKLLKPKNIIYIPTAFLLISLALPLVSKVLLKYRLDFPQNISQRIELSFGAGSLISQKFLVGTGLNTFIINEPRIKYLGSYLWTLQPVHNVFLLVFSETGIFGLLLTYYLLIRSFQKAILLNNKTFYLALAFILVTGLVDHYWFTLQQNLFLFAFVLGNSFREKS
ncbi:MAG: O-antigen ligase family protein, partial [Candidatus Woesebacteria bacterium]|nr:O-antigen ligase family protein [Candidatus Woesebacteria bacterium]